MLLDRGFQAVIDSMVGVPMNISHVVIGDSDSPVQPTDLSLGNELFRKPIASVYRQDESIIVEAFVDTFEANFEWKEIGIVANGDIYAQKSGGLVARAIISEKKDELRTASIIWTIDLVRG